MSTPGQVLATIPLDTTPKWVTVAPDGSRVYVTSDVSAPGAIVVIDTASNAVVASVPVGHASRVAIAPDGRHAYVANQGSPQGTAEVSVIDTSTTTVVDHIALGGSGVATAGVAITPDGRRLYVAMSLAFEDHGAVSVIDTATGTIVDTITIGASPAEASVRPDGRFVYVLDRGGEPPAVIDTASHDRTFGFGDDTGQLMAITPDGRLAYVIRESDVQVSVVDVATGAVIGATEATGLTTDIAGTPDGRFFYATQRTRHQISVFEVGLSPPVPTHPVAWSGTADAIAMMPDGTTAYVSDRRSLAVHVIPVGVPA